MEENKVFLKPDDWYKAIHKYKLTTMFDYDETLSREEAIVRTIQRFFPEWTPEKITESIQSCNPGVFNV